MPDQSSEPWEELKPSAKPREEVRRRPSIWRILEVGIALVVIAGLVAAVVIARRQINDTDQLNQARSSALAAAQTYAVDIATYDYHHLDQDFQKVTDHSTGTFKDQFSKASNDLKPLIVQYQGTAKATVRSAAVSDISTDKATVVLFVDQTVTNTNSPTPRVDRNRVTIQLVRQNGQWLMTQVDLV